MMQHSVENDDIANTAPSCGRFRGLPAMSMHRPECSTSKKKKNCHSFAERPNTSLLAELPAAGLGDEVAELPAAGLGDDCQNTPLLTELPAAVIALFDPLQSPISERFRSTVGNVSR